MKTVRLGLKGQTVPEIIQQARTIVSRMDGNKNFSSPNPSLAEMTEAVATLENAYEDALDGGKSKKILLRQCESEFKGLIKMLAAYVQNASAGDENIIVSSGFEVRRVSPATVPAGNPARVRGSATIREGEVIIRWDGAIGARCYTAQMSMDGTTWTDCDVSTKTKLTVSGLVSGTRPLFRVAAIGPLGQSGWSDPGAVWVH